MHRDEYLRLSGGDVDFGHNFPIAVGHIGNDNVDLDEPRADDSGELDPGCDSSDSNHEFSKETVAFGLYQRRCRVDCRASR